MDAIIYDITQDPEQVKQCSERDFRLSLVVFSSLQIDEAVWACQKLESIVNELDHPITFILLSSIMTWTKTQPSEVCESHSQRGIDAHRERSD